MKTLGLCCVGFLAGTAAAFLTQTPFFESLGSATNIESESAPTEITELVSNDEPETKPMELASDDSESNWAAENPTSREQKREYAKGSYLHTRSRLRLPYRMLAPKNLVPGKRYPLVVFLHGAGERGSDNESQLMHGSEEFAQWASHKETDSFVLFPQCPDDQQWAAHDWAATEHTMLTNPTRSMQALMALIDDVSKNQSIDNSRIYAAGLSMGGFGVFDLIARRPGFFAAGAALCGGTDCSLKSVQKLSLTPMYIVHGSEDNIVGVENSRNVVASLRKLGAKPKYVELEGVGHNCWDSTFSNNDLFAWLYSNKSNNPKSRFASVDSGTSTKDASPPTAQRITNSFVRKKKPVPATAKTKPDARSKAPSVATKKKRDKSRSAIPKKRVAVSKPTKQDVEQQKETEVTVAKAKAKAKVKAKAKAKAKVKAIVKAKAKPAKSNTTVESEATATAKSKATTKSQSKAEVVAKESTKPQVKAPPRLKGKWQVVEAIHAGHNVSEKKTKAMTLEFVGENVVIKQGDRSETGTFVAGKIIGEQENSFAKLEIKSTRENVPPIKGFYFKNGDVLTMVWGAPGKKRPNPNVIKELEAARTLVLNPSAKK